MIKPFDTMFLLILNRVGPSPSQMSKRGTRLRTMWLQPMGPLWTNEHGHRTTKRKPTQVVLYSVPRTVGVQKQETQVTLRNYDFHSPVPWNLRVKNNFSNSSVKKDPTVVSCDPYILIPYLLKFKYYIYCQRWRSENN